MLESNTLKGHGQGRLSGPALVDSHAHLDLFPEDTLPGLVERARSNGVWRILSVSVDAVSSRKNISISEKFQEILVGIGLHPLRVSEEHGDAEYSALESMASHPRVVAVGEAGLDFVDASSSRVLQEYWLRRQIRLSQETRLPLVIHCRAATEDLRKILLECGGLPSGGVVHYFVGSPSEALAFLEMGLYVSVGRPVGKTGMADLAHAVEILPLDRLLLETDSYPLPGRLTEPASIIEVAEAVAHIKGISCTEVIAATAENFLRLFSKAS